MHFNNILALSAASENCNPLRNLTVYDCNTDNGTEITLIENTNNKK
jgi:hypothetical protein